MTTASATTWPTLAELEAVARQVNAGLTAFEELPFKQLGEAQFDEPDAPVLSVEYAGGLAWFLAAIEADLRNMEAYLEETRDAWREAALRMRLDG